MSKLKAALTWPFTHEPALVFAAVAALVGLVNAKWGLHLDAAQVITWIATALGVGVVTRQTVVSPSTYAKKVGRAEKIGYRKGHEMSRVNPPVPPPA